jgi:hypothetical protein
MSRTKRKPAEKSHAAAEALSGIAPPFAEEAKQSHEADGGLNPGQQDAESGTSNAPASAQGANPEAVARNEDAKLDADRPALALAVAHEEVPDDAPMTDTERADYRRMMASIKTMCIEAAKMILEIRRRKLYREEFKTFDEWVACYFGKTRQWVTGLSNWVRRHELLEMFARNGPLALPFNGKPAYQIVPKEAEVLAPLEDHPEELCRALAEATDLCRRNPKRKRTKVLEEMVKLQGEYRRRREGVPDLTYEEFLAINSVGWSGRTSDEIVSEVNALKAQGGDWMGRLVEAVQEGDLSSDVLLRCARGQELIDLCAKLKVQKEVREELKQAEKEAKEAAAKLERKMVEVAKRQEAADRQMKEKQEEPGEGAGGETDLDDEEEEEVNEGLPVFEVDMTGSFVGIPERLAESVHDLLEGWKANLFEWNLEMDSAIIVKPALHTTTWPRGKLLSAKDLLEAALAMMQEVFTSLQADGLDDEGEVSLLLGTARECETKLAEITAKAKELLADAEEPEAVPNGND